MIVRRKNCSAKVPRVSVAVNVIAYPAAVPAAGVPLIVA